MKDLDFDELDRAVNSVTETTDKPLSINAGPPEKLLTEPASSQSTTTIAPRLAGRRNTGRFMDVVPPSSNTRLSPTIPKRVSRQGITIDPTNKPAIVPDEVLPSVPVDTSSKKVDSTSDWPDPIDFKPTNNSTDDPEEPIKNDNEDADIDKISNDITNTLSQTPDESPDSPFISGTKVDKRPLGAFSTESSTSTIKSSEPETIPIKTVVDAKPINLTTPFPAELQSDILSIEASSNTTNPNEPTAPIVVPKTVVTPATDDQPIGPTSITQQYKEQPSSGDKNTSAIYHTEAYHRALLHTTKKKSGWMLVVWISILIIAGAGAGAAVYFFVLPGL